MNTIRFVLLGFSITWIVACGSGGGSSGSPNPAPDPINVTPENWLEIVNNPNLSLDLRIEAATLGVNLDVCFQRDKVDDCEWQVFTAGGNSLDQLALSDETVLIIDELVPAVGMLRHRKRVEEFYSIEGFGNINPVAMEWELPKVFGEVVTAFASLPAIPSDELTDVGIALESAYGDHVPTFGSHGIAVYKILIDLVPRHPVVLLNNHNLPYHRAVPEVFCAVDSADAADPNLTMLRAYSNYVADNLKQVIARHNIRFINASWGYTIETIRGPWMTVCDSEVPTEDILLAILATYKPIFEVLFNTDGVFTAHAGFLSPINEHYPYDQKSPDFPNRVRVGFFVHTSNDVPPAGLSVVPGSFQPTPGIDDVDIYVNVACASASDCRSTRPLSLSGLYDMGRLQFPVPQTSFSTPLLLGHFIYLRNLPEYSDAPMDNAVIESLIDRVAPLCEASGERCIYIDPLLYNQFDL